MPKKSHQSRSAPSRSDGDQRLFVWGDRRKEPDWDAFVAALIAYALREVDEGTESQGPAPEGKRG